MTYIIHIWFYIGNVLYANKLCYIANMCGIGL